MGPKTSPAPRGPLAKNSGRRPRWGDLIHYQQREKKIIFGPEGLKEEKINRPPPNVARKKKNGKNVWLGEASGFWGGLGRTWPEESPPLEQSAFAPPAGAGAPWGFGGTWGWGRHHTLFVFFFFFFFPDPCVGASGSLRFPSSAKAQSWKPGLGASVFPLGTSAWEKSFFVFFGHQVYL